MEVQSLQKEISVARNRELLGREVEVLVEGPSRKDPRRLSGRTRDNRIVHFEGPGLLAGTFRRVRITEAGFVALGGEVVPENDHR
jgi:tRNA-2-methylthio-N6-dimethylallyladenosine synthase